MSAKSEFPKHREEELRHYGIYKLTYDYHEVQGWLKRMIGDFPKSFETDPYWHDLHEEVDGREALEWFNKWLLQFRNNKE